MPKKFNGETDVLYKKKKDLNPKIKSFFLSQKKFKKIYKKEERFR